MTDTIYWTIELENYNELYALIQKVEQSLLHLNVTVWTKNSFIKNTEHNWYVAISIESDGINYIYIFKYNTKYKILYGFTINTNTVGQLPLTMNSNPSLFNMFYKSLVSTIGENKLIHQLPLWYYTQ
jgi:hypothetical protein